MRALIPFLALTLAACVPQGSPTGAEDFASYCAACHGAGGKGDGPMAAELGRSPADLTTLSARNGGRFPGTRVMAKIWGPAGGGHGDSVMPGFRALLEGELVPYDGGDGIASPTPARLVAIAEYLKSIQSVP